MFYDIHDMQWNVLIWSTTLRHVLLCYQWNGETWGVLYSLISVKMLGSHAHMYVTCIGYFSLWWVRTLTLWKWKWLLCLTWCYNGHYFFLVFSNNTRDASPTSTRTKGCANHLEGPYSHIWFVCRVVNTHSMTRIRKLSKRIQF